MALTLGTNVGFVTVRPTADPAGTNTTIDGSSVVTKDTSPSNAIKITEIGWYRGAGTNAANFEVALYSESAGVAGARVAIDATNTSTTQGWITTTVDWAISGSTAYWLAVQMDAHTGSSSIDTATSGGSGTDVRTSQTALADPYGGGAVADADGMYAIYALVELLTIAPNDIAISLTEDNDTITQDHIVADQDVSNAVTIDVTTITQNHIISTDDIAISLTSDNTTVEEQVAPIDIFSADATISLTTDETTITQNHVFSPDDIVFSLTSDNDTIEQNHIVVPQDVAIGLTVDTTTISQNHIIASDDIAISLTIDNTTILQDHIIASQDALVSLTADATTITQEHLLPAEDVAISLGIDTTTISQNHIIDTQEILISLSEDNAVVTEQGGGLVTIITNDLFITVSLDQSIIQIPSGYKIRKAPRAYASIEITPPERRTTSEKADKRLLKPHLPPRVL